MLLGPILDAPAEEWERMIDVNVRGLLYCARTALPHLLQAAEGEPRRTADLVNVSSVAGRMMRLGSGVYSATKHAVGAFSESLRQEVTGRHVRVSLVEPGAVATELSSHNRPEVLETIKQRFADTEHRRRRAPGPRGPSSHASPRAGGCRWSAPRSRRPQRREPTRRPHGGQDERALVGVKPAKAPGALDGGAPVHGQHRIVPGRQRWTLSPYAD